MTDHPISTLAAMETMWPAMPTHLTRFLETSPRFTRRFDLRAMTQFRFTFDVREPGAVSASLLLRSAPDGETWTTIRESIVTFGANAGRITSGWQALPVRARSDVALSLWGQDGDGKASPVFDRLRVEFR